MPFPYSWFSLPVDNQNLPHKQKNWHVWRFLLTHREPFRHRLGNAVLTALTVVSWIITKPHFTWFESIIDQPPHQMNIHIAWSGNNLILQNVQDLELPPINVPHDRKAILRQPTGQRLSNVRTQQKKIQSVQSYYYIMRKVKVKFEFKIV